MRSFLLAVALLVLAGCSSKATTKEVVYKDIDRVFIHSGNRVSFFKEKEDGSIQHEFLNSRAFGDIKYFSDVPKEQKMWAKEKTVEDSMVTSCYVEINLHSVDEVDGGEWNHGKHGSGTVNVVE